MEWYYKVLQNEKAVLDFLKLLDTKHKLNANRIKISGFVVYYFHEFEVS